MQTYMRTAATHIADAAEMEIDDVLALMAPPPDPSMGDFGMPCFPLAKTLRKAPPAIAAELAERIGRPEPFSAVTATGPYLNFRVDPAVLARETLSAARDENRSWGASDEGAGKTVVVDFSSPNIAKPLAIHHVRSTILGAALARIHDFLGYTVERVNHLGDWGTNFGQLMVSYKRREADTPDADVDIDELLRLYIRFHEEAEDDADMNDEAKAWFARLEQGDEEAVRLWTLFCEKSLESFKRLYERLNVSFDHYIGESFFNDRMEETLRRIDEKGLSEMSEGALVVRLDDVPGKKKMPPCLLRKQDGSTLYATRDLAAAEYRHERWGFHRCLYVVANQQELHFRQVFAVLRKMGYEWAENCVHVKFGMLSFGKGVFADSDRATGSTRKGRIVFLQDVLDRAKAKAGEIVRDNAREDWVRDHADELAEQVGAGAVVFNEFTQRRMKDVVFTWESALNLQGDSGPYLQYTHARLCSVLRKAGMEVPPSVDTDALGTDAEMAVVRALARFPQTVRRSAEEYEPALVAEYLFELAAAFNRFYTDREAHRIITDDDALTLARLALTDATRRVLATGLSLLGLTAPERM